LNEIVNKIEIGKFTPLTFTSSLIHDLGWFINLRWLAAIGVTGFTLFLHSFAYGEHFFVPCFMVSGMIALFNVGYLLIYKSFRNKGTPNVFQERAFASLQIGMDWIFLTILAYYTGGIVSPFVFFYVFHIIISAILLPRMECYIQTGFVVILVGILVLLQILKVIPYHAFIFSGDSKIIEHYPHILMLYAFFSFMLIVSSFFATTLSGRIRRRNDELNRLKRDLETAIAKLRSQDEALLDLTYKTAHELRAPLSAIQSILNALLQGYSGDMSNDVKEMLMRAELRSNSLILMTTELLNLAKKQEESSKELKELNLKTILEHIYQLFTQQSASKSLDYKLSLPTENLTMMAREEDLQLLFSNIIENAIKYTPKGKKVSVELARHDNSARLIVADAGIGIPPESRYRLFDRFYRAPNARSMEALGTGLGLSLVKRIVDSYNGTIIFASEVGEGTTFTIMLPLKG
jgi:signal transduction histidine kinase